MMRAMVRTFLLVAALAAATQALADARRGEEFYDSICSSCHRAGGNPGSGPIANGAGRPEVIQSALRSVPEMLVFSRLLSAADVVDIADYLAELFGAPPPPPPPPAGILAAVEYYHDGLRHYFTTAIPSEIAALDSGQVAGWVRTGGSFAAWASVAAGTAGATPVCRIYIPPEFGNSHFYSASPVECADTRERFPAFDFEADEVMAVMPAHPLTGACPAATVPVYRLWNMRVDVNHRYTTSRDTRATMIAEGHVPEGYGDEGVAFCAPAP